MQRRVNRGASRLNHRGFPTPTPKQPPRPPEGDLVVLASASAARAFGRLGVDIPAVSIGPLTTQAAREAGVEVVREAETHDLAGLLAAIGSAACSSPS